MKILVAIESDKNSDRLANTTLRWAGRSGYNTRIFIPDKRQLNKYKRAVEEANYQYYLDLPYTVIVHDEQPLGFAIREGFDLLVYLRDDMLDWRTVGDDDRTLMDFVTDLGAARLEMGANPRKRVIRFKNGTKMVRITNKKPFPGTPPHKKRTGGLKSKLTPVTETPPRRAGENG